MPQVNNKESCCAPRGHSAARPPCSLQQYLHRSSIQTGVPKPTVLCLNAALRAGPSENTAWRPRAAARLGCRLSSTRRAGQHACQGPAASRAWSKRRGAAAAAEPALADGSTSSRPSLQAPAVACGRRCRPPTLPSWRHWPDSRATCRPSTPPLRMPLVPPPSQPAKGHESTPWLRCCPPPHLHRRLLLHLHRRLPPHRYRRLLPRLHRRLPELTAVAAGQGRAPTRRCSAPQ